MSRGGERRGKGKESSFLFPPAIRLYYMYSRPIFCTLYGSDVCFFFRCSVDDVVMSLYYPMNRQNVKECVS